MESPNGFFTAVFAAETWTGEPADTEPGKHDAVRWVDTDSIPEDFVSTTRAALMAYLNGGSAVSLEGWACQPRVRRAAGDRRERLAGRHVKDLTGYFTMAIRP